MKGFGVPEVCADPPMMPLPSLGRLYIAGEAAVDCAINRGFHFAAFDNGPAL